MDKPIYKQLKLQRSYIARGLCRACGKEPIVKYGMGEKCAAKAKIRNRNRYRKSVGIPIEAPLWTHAKPAKSAIQSA